MSIVQKTSCHVENASNAEQETRSNSKVNDDLTFAT
jgi:hypothetical protein